MPERRLVVNRRETEEKMISQTDRLLTTKEVAIWLKLSYRSLENARQQGKGPPFVRIGRAIRYLEDEVRKWLRQ
jgi:predicted DNA-binding transcriptional regulator AlpA